MNKCQKHNVSNVEVSEQQPYTDKLQHGPLTMFLCDFEVILDNECFGGINNNYYFLSWVCHQIQPYNILIIFNSQEKTPIMGPMKECEIGDPTALIPLQTYKPTIQNYCLQFNNTELLLLLLLLTTRYQYLA